MNLNVENFQLSLDCTAQRTIINLIFSMQLSWPFSSLKTLKETKPIAQPVRGEIFVVSLSK